MSVPLSVPTHIADERAEQLARQSAMSATSEDDFISPIEAVRQFNKLTDQRIPQPKGWRVLVLALMPPETAGEIVLVDQYREARGVASPQGILLSLGASAYDKKRFPEGPWCEIGDRIIFAKYAGRGFRLANGQLLFFLNDDEIMGVIDNVRDVEKQLRGYGENDG